MKILNLLLRKVKAGSFLLLLFVLLCQFSSNAQSITVSGTVSSSDDQGPIPGVSVVIKGTQKGVSTDFDGLFSIKANVGDILDFSYIGMAKKSLKVKNATMNVVLNPDVESLDEIVVIGYGTQKKKELTGAVARVKLGDIENIVTADLGDALQGQISGVSVVASGEPGAESQIVIRGVTSISGSNSPLYVVDGIPQSGDPGLSPNEIESIDVLKDAASAAVYGTRGAAGVILITTKKGEKGSLKVRISGSKSFESLTGEKQPLLNSLEQTYIDLLTVRNLGGTADNQIPITALTNSPDRFQEDSDISTLLFVDDASTENYVLNVGGGTETLNYNFVGSFYDRKGIISRTDYNRFNSRANVTYTKDKLSVNIGLGLVKINNNRGSNNVIGQLIRYNPTQPVLEVDADTQNSAGGDDFNTNVSILNQLRQVDVESSTRTFVNAAVTYKITDDLTLITRAGINEFNSNRKIFRPVSRIYDFGRDETVEQPSSVFNRAQRNSAVTWDAALTYEKHILENHHLTLTGAVSSERYDTEIFSVSTAGVQDNDVQVQNGATGITIGLSGPDRITRLFGTLGRLQYDYKGKYLISGSVRRDGSSRFAEQNRWGVFPSISAAWNVSDEAFWEPIKGVVNNFKIRISNGSVGNQSFNDYSYATPIQRGIDYTYGNGAIANGAIQNTIGNSDVKWESSTQSNLGIDLALFKNKLTFSAEYYRAANVDMLFPITLPGSVGLDDTSSGGNNANFSIRNFNNNNQVVLNIGNMTNTGYEFAVGFRDRIGKVRYNFNGTLSSNKNKITQILDGLDGPILTNDRNIVPGTNGTVTAITALAKGYEVGSFFVRTTDGIANTPERLAEYQKLKPDAQLGDLIYKDNNGDSVVDEGDRVYAGSGLPKFEIGFNARFNYKNFDLYANLFAALGHEVVNGARATALGYGRGKELLNQFSEVNPNGTLPSYRGIFSAHPNYAPNSDLFIEDGSYLRIRNITFGYTFPKKVVDAIGINRFRIYATGQNMFTFTKYTGYNPAVGGNVNSRGLDKGSYPLTKQIIFGINFDF